MIFMDFSKGVIFSAQTAVGILGNFSLVYCYVFLSYTEHKLRSTDLILKHLMMANALVLLSTGVPQTMTAFRLKHLFNDFTCKLTLYIQRVGRSVSISIICLLSVFQAIKICPMNSTWKDLKVKATKYITFSIYLCWILYMVVNLIFPIYHSGKWNKNVTKRRDLEYCSTGRDKISDSLYTALLVFPEVLFSVIIIWSSGSMTLILYRHKQQVQHIHSAHLSSRLSPESRATQNILALVCTFVSFYTLSSILNACVAVSYNSSWWLANSNALISVCFPTVSPFLMSRDSQVFRLCFHWVRNTKSPNIINV
ncbi:vomeronasal 1 receptor oryCunV1R1658 isoform X1 [Oryctolagus cuniculus]|uniref:vomeronasal 1 receptor oryCunV1R1658 isoform X1 n=1 Tax=Oryctolagus cuniculus TaxID=9986 RepID=UPI0038790E74